MFGYNPCGGHGAGGYGPSYGPGCGRRGYYGGSTFTLIVVLFILLIIVGCSFI